VDPVQKTLFGAVFWTFLGVGLLGFGIYSSAITAEWKRWIGVGLALTGLLILFGTFAEILRLFDPCYAWPK
jgi:hypothetical protein